MDCLCRPSRIMSVRINLLDETDFIHEIKDDLPGQALLDVVFARLNLIETSYFGIRYIDEENQTHWLDPASRISRQLKPKSDPYDLYFGVKFYAADPCKLLEEITRYQLFLQVKQDVLQGRLPVAFELAAELGAFVVQSELGDYDQRRHSKGYVSEFRLLPNQSSELETRVAELHQQLKGMSPATAELNFLDKVKWHDMYGVDLHPVLGEDSVEYFLGLTPSGIVVLRNKTTVAHYYWPRIAKVYYKGRYFMLRISDKNNDLSTYGFETPRKSACKHLWRCCVEHHAFFRLVRVAPLPNSQSNTSDLFQLGSRLRYSGRSEKQAAKDAMLSIGRTPPAFTRVPSKRQPRRVIDDFLNGTRSNSSRSISKTVESYGSPIAAVPVIATAIATTTAQLTKSSGAAVMQQPSGMTANYESPYRSTYSIPTSLGIRPYHQQHNNNSGSYSNNNNNGGSSSCGGGNSNLQTPDSPRSTRSAPWPRSQQRSLFGNNPSSPRSVRSARTTGDGGGSGSSRHHHHSHQHHHHHHQHQQQQQQQHRKQSNATHASSQRGDHVPSHQQRYRSSSVESHSSNDSRSTRRHKHRHRRTSDNESELSRGSGRSGRSHHRKHRRSRHRRDSAGSEHDSSRRRSYSGHRSSSARSGSAELIDSTSQWREVQRRQAEASLGQSSVQQASVSKSSMVARSLNSNDSHSDTHSHHKSRRHRKNKSPSDSRNRIWSSELAKHLQFGLVDTAGMTEDQLREIPYTVVETNSKRSNPNLKIHKSSSKGSVGGKSTGSGNTITNGSGSASGQGKNRVDRIRGLYFQSSNPNDSAGAKNGSIRSASTISSRECERNTGLVRMMSSMSMGDFISPTGSNLSPLENSALRVSHEHTDSGLGADQDYAYSSERSSDSTRYGTNKSSGASSGSHRKSTGAGSGSTYNSLMQQTVSNQQHQQPPQQRQNSFYAQRPPPTPQSQKHNYKCQAQSTNQNPSKSLAPIHKTPHSSHHSSTTTNPTNIINNNNNSINTIPAFGGGGNEKSTSSSSTSSAIKANNNRLLNYTTFENNQYKFSLNNVFSNGKHGTSSGGGNIPTHLDSFVEWPSYTHAAAPYYYNGPPTASVNVKKRDAKSDIGVPIRRLSGHQALTKTQLLSGGQMSNVAGCYPMPSAGSSTSGGALQTRLHPAKSDLFLAYHGEFERPYIYNYKMPQMPELLRPANQPPPNAAYHISGAQTADPPPLYKPLGSGSAGGSGILYGGAAPATDVMYYQFDNSKSAPIIQQPKSSVNQTTSEPSTSQVVVASGPLVFLQYGSNVASSNAASAPQTCTNINNNNTTTTTTHPNSNSHSHSSACSEEDPDEDAVTSAAEEEEEEGAAAAARGLYDNKADATMQLELDAMAMSVSNNNNNKHNNYTSSEVHCSPRTAAGIAATNKTASVSASGSAPVSASANINHDNCNANVNATNNNNNQNTSTPTTTTTPRHHHLPPPPTPPTSNNSCNAYRNPHHPNPHPHPNANRNRTESNFNSIQNQNQNISSSLEIILSPIIQSSRRAQ